MFSTFKGLHEKYSRPTPDTVIDPEELAAAVRLLEAFPWDENAACNFGMMAGYMCENKRLMDAFLAANSLHVLIRSMTYFPSTHLLQFSACLALDNLLGAHPEVLPELLSAGLVPMLQAVVKERSAMLFGDDTAIELLKTVEKLQVCVCLCMCACVHVCMCVCVCVC